MNKRREFWITNPPECWKYTIVSTFQNSIKRENEEVIHVKEVKHDDPENIDLIIKAERELKELIIDIYNGMHKGEGLMGAMPDDEICDIINEKMSKTYGNNWY